MYNFIGDFMSKDFFKFAKKLFCVSLPIVIQQLFLNIASLLDTLMVGQLDESSISGVYIATQIIFVINLMVFGSIEGGSVFLCQFKGAKDKNNITKSFAFKLYFSLIISVITTLVILLFNKQLVSLFTDDETVIKIACNYLLILSTSLIPYAITNSISTSMRELDHPIAPMIITAIAILCNLLINYLLIYGSFGFSKLGATGAAIGTIFERFLETIVLIILCRIHKYEFLFNLNSNYKLSREMIKQMFIKSLPLLINETLWSLGQSTLIFFFSKVDPIATVVLPISSTIYNLMFVVCLGIGNGISIIVGETIGAANYKKGQTQGYYSLISTLIISFILGMVLYFVAPFIVNLYGGIGEQAKNIAKVLIRFNAFYIIICATNNALFFLMRSGGRTTIVLLFDSFYAFIIQIPACILLLNINKLSFIPFVCIIYSLDIIKLIIGGSIVISKKWIKNITEKFSMS